MLAHILAYFHNKRIYILAHILGIFHQFSFFKEFLLFFPQNYDFFFIFHVTYTTYSVGKEKKERKKKEKLFVLDADAGMRSSRCTFFQQVPMQRSPPHSLT